VITRIKNGVENKAPEEWWYSEYSDTILNITCPKRHTYSSLSAAAASSFYYAWILHPISWSVSLGSTDSEVHLHLQRNNYSFWLFSKLLGASWIQWIWGLLYCICMLLGRRSNCCQVLESWWDFLLCWLMILSAIEPFYEGLFPAIEHCVRIYLSSTLEFPLNFWNWFRWLSGTEDMNFCYCLISFHHFTLLHFLSFRKTCHFPAFIFFSEASQEIIHEPTKQLSTSSDICCSIIFCRSRPAPLLACFCFQSILQQLSIDCPIFQINCSCHESFWCFWER